MITTQETILHRLQQGLAELTGRKQQPSAGDTRNLLIDPLLEHLGYPPTYQRREFTGNHCRPDIILWEETRQPVRRPLPAASSSRPRGSTRTSTTSRESTQPPTSSCSAT